MEKLQVKILIGLAKAFPGAQSYSLFVFACVLCANQNFMTIDCKIVRSAKPFDLFCFCLEERSLKEGITQNDCLKDETQI